MTHSTRSLAPSRWNLPSLLRMRFPRPPKWFLILVPAVALLIPALSQSSVEPQYPADQVTTTPVLKGQFRRTLTQMGVIRSQSNVTLVSHVEDTTAIVSILPEGTRVQKGELIAQLDDAELVSDAQDRKIRVFAAESALKQAQEALTMQALTNESLLSAAQLKADLAALDLEAWNEGRSKQQLFDLKASLALAEETYTRSQKSLEFVKQQAAKGYRSIIDVEQERLAVLRSRHKFELAQQAIELFEKFTNPRSLVSLTGLKKQASDQVEQRQKLGEISLRAREIRVKAAELALSIQNEAMKTIERNIAACKIIAPRAGEVVYAERRYSRSGELIAAGTRVGYQDPIVQLPDREALQVAIAVHESMVRTLSEGQSATISLEALPDLALAGAVKSINLQPRPGNFPNYDLRENEVIVELLAEPETLKQIAPGLTASVEIETLRLDEATYIPMESVVEVTGKHYALVCHHGIVEPRPIVVGETNDNSVLVVSGLREGERVASTPRSECAALIADLGEEAFALVDTSSSEQDDEGTVGE